MARLFGALDARRESLGVVDYGLSLPTLEEVFLQLADAADDADALSEGSDSGEVDAHGAPCHASPDAAHVPAEPCDTGDDGDDAPLLGGAGGRRAAPRAAFWTQARAMMKLRFLQLRRNPRASFFQLILPPIFVLIALSLHHGGSPTSTTSTLALDPAVYGHGKGDASVVPYTGTGPSHQLDAFAAGLDAQAGVHGLRVDTALQGSSHSYLSRHRRGYVGALSVNFTGAGARVDVLYNDTDIHAMPMCAFLPLQAHPIVLCAANNVARGRTATPGWRSVRSATLSALGATCVLHHTRSRRGLAFCTTGPYSRRSCLLA